MGWRAHSADECGGEFNVCDRQNLSTAHTGPGGLRETADALAQELEKALTRKGPRLIEAIMA